MNEIINITYFDSIVLLVVLACTLSALLLLNQYIRGIKKSLDTVKTNIRYLNKKRLEMDFNIYKYSTIASVNESKIKEVKNDLKKEIFLVHSASCSATMDILIGDFIKKSSKKELEDLFVTYNDGKHPILTTLLLDYAPKEPAKKKVTKKKVTKKKVTKKKVTRKKKS